MSGTEKQDSPKPNPFDQLMFGRQAQSSAQYDTKGNDSTMQKETDTQSQSKQEEFDIFNTTQTVMETYQQLSPYVKGVSRMFKKFKS